MVDFLEAQFLPLVEGPLAAASTLAVEDVGLVLVQLGKLRFEIVGKEIDILGILQVSAIKLSLGANVDDEGALGGIFGCKQFGGLLCFDVDDGTRFLLLRLSGNGASGEENSEEEGCYLSHARKLAGPIAIASPLGARGLDGRASREPYHPMENRVGENRRSSWVFARTMCMALALSSLSSISTVEAEEAKRTDLRESAQAWVGRQAFGIYMVGKKAGFGAIEIEIAGFQGKPALRETLEMQLQVKAFGEVSRMTSTEEVWYSLEGEGVPLQIAETMVEDGTTTRKILEVRDGQWVVVTQVGERTEKRVVDAPKKSLVRELEIEQWLESSPKKGAKHELWLVDLDKAEINQKESMEYVGSERRVLSGVAKKVHKVKMTMDGAPAEVQLLNQKVFLEISAGNLMRVVAEEERVARRMDTKLADLGLQMSVAIKRDLGDEPGKIQELVAEVSGLDGFEFPESHRQHLERREGKPALLHLRRDFEVGEGEALEDSERKKWTAAQPGIESEDEVIRKRARAIVGKAAKPRAMAARLQSWVYNNLETTMAKNSSSARTILKQRAGDCTECARLFVAFARSLDLPAREVTGLLYTKFDKPMFGWHAWAEIHDGHQWVSVDPAWDQVFVDATHIQLGTGPEDLAWISVVGELKLKVVEFKK